MMVLEYHWGPPLVALTRMSIRKYREMLENIGKNRKKAVHKIAPLADYLVLLSPRPLLANTPCSKR